MASCTVVHAGPTTSPHGHALALGAWLLLHGVGAGHALAHAPLTWCPSVVAPRVLSWAHAHTLPWSLGVLGMRWVVTTWHSSLVHAHGATVWPSIHWATWSHWAATLVASPICISRLATITWAHAPRGTIEIT